jgi:hypothetical protein
LGTHRHSRAHRCPAPCAEQAQLIGRQRWLARARASGPPPPAAPKTRTRLSWRRRGRARLRGDQNPRVSAALRAASGEGRPPVASRHYERAALTAAATAAHLTTHVALVAPLPRSSTRRLGGPPAPRMGDPRGGGPVEAPSRCTRPCENFVVWRFAPSSLLPQRQGWWGMELV